MMSVHEFSGPIKKAKTFKEKGSIYPPYTVNSLDFNLS